MTHFSMVPNSHFGSLLKGILIPWNLAIFCATSAEMLGSLSSQVSSLRLCKGHNISHYPSIVCVAYPWRVFCCFSFFWGWGGGLGSDKRHWLGDFQPMSELERTPSYWLFPLQINVSYTESARVSYTFPPYIKLSGGQMSSFLLTNNKLFLSNNLNIVKYWKCSLV